GPHRCGPERLRRSIAKRTGAPQSCPRALECALLRRVRPFMPDSACPVPASVVDALDRIGGRDATPERRHWEVLAATNPVYRFGTGEAAWIVKRPKDADKDL